MSLKRLQLVYSLVLHLLRLVLVCHTHSCHAVSGSICLDSLGKRLLPRFQCQQVSTWLTRLYYVILASFATLGKWQKRDELQKHAMSASILAHGIDCITMGHQIWR